MQVMQNLAILTMILFYEPVGLYAVDRSEEEVKKIKENSRAISGTLTGILSALLTVDTEDDEAIASAIYAINNRCTLCSYEQPSPERWFSILGLFFLSIDCEGSFFCSESKGKAASWEKIS
jgi:nitrate reductase assembly molybdenum cofactor insertion protein NarJ